jgi:hypothetical protein
VSWPGRRCLEHLDRGEREVAYWQRHARKLTAEERRRISHGDYSSIVRPLPPEWVVGAWLAVAADLEIRPEEPLWRRGSYRIPFGVRDFRVRLLRRAPRMAEAQLDSEGRPLEPGPTAVAAARLDGSYTRSYRDAVPDAGDAVDDETLERFAREAGKLGELRELIEHPQRVFARDELRKRNKLRKLQREARAKGIDITPELDRAIREIQSKLAGG